MATSKGTLLAGIKKVTRLLPSDMQDAGMPQKGDWQNTFATIPPELFAEIFSHCLPESGFARPSHKEAPVMLLLVCKYWRDIAMSLPHLWASFEINLSRASSQARVLEVTDAWIRRAKKLPLSVKLTYQPPFMTADRVFNPTSAALLSSLLLHSPRWRQIHLSVPGRTLQPMLDTMPPIECPMLRSFKLNIGGLWPATESIDIRRLGLHWELLTELDVSTDLAELLTLCEWSGILSECTSLQRCGFRARPVLHLAERNIQDVPLHCLKELRLNLQCAPGDERHAESHLLRFLRQLQFTMLEKFEISMQGSSLPSWHRYHGAFVTFLDSLQANLEHFSLSYFPLTDDDLALCLRALPYLTSLRFRSNVRHVEEDPVSDRLLEALTLSGSRELRLLKHLQAIDLECSGHWTAPAMIDMVESRLLEKGVRLEKLRVLSGHPIPRECVTRVQRWRNVGLDVDLTSLKIR